MSNAVPQMFKLPLIDSDQNTCAFCGTHVAVELSVSGKHAGQYYIKCLSKEIHTNGKAFWFFFPPGVKPSKQTAVMSSGLSKTVSNRTNLVTDNN
ncbi:uncharacterized protein LACBIDRAFT_298906 [Laccaria bicolor S238N-H82]|uniref:Predicted protein n=1 Tax=Laccaria bicolor (strain S238N-H82 / ATCC MYA-4686) TaxID=486041 RepID=B0DDK2_LACBS|nr:uncharacterized protein LACBIDRAFT_298906 [Laccaria bicolor S238N-H82]EDR07102.1 predicted protein [Laccaria bicolor S238N-H82]|eukprot:XP_001882033.1 predicted protein [Laccaria bicolor S238N-H82]